MTSVVRCWLLLLVCMVASAAPVPKVPQTDRQKQHSGAALASHAILIGIDGLTLNTE